MYYIYTTDGTSLGTAEEVNYIKIGTSGSFAPSTADDAVGVAVNSTAYNLYGFNKIANADTAIVIYYDGTDGVEQLAAAKIAEISASCNATITAGIDVEFDDRTDHFNLATEDQSNISNLFRVVELGGTEYPYQADDGVCTVYTAAQIAQIYIAAQTAITYNTTYHNVLKSYVQTLDDVDDLLALAYGMELPADYQTILAEKLAVSTTQISSIVANLGGAK